MNNFKRTKRLYCPAMTESLSSMQSSETGKMDHSIPIKKRKITNSKVEEIKSINNQHNANKTLNLQIKNSEEKENSNFLSNFNKNSISSPISNLAMDLNKIKINQKSDNVTSKLPGDRIDGLDKNNFKNLSKNPTIHVHNIPNNKTTHLKRNFSLSELNTQSRTNFKNIFQEIIKNQTELNRNFKKTNSFSSAHSNSNINFNPNILNMRNDLNTFNTNNNNKHGNKINIFPIPIQFQEKVKI